MTAGWRWREIALLGESAGTEEALRNCLVKEGRAAKKRKKHKNDRAGVWFFLLFCAFCG